MKALHYELFLDSITRHDHKSQRAHVDGDSRPVAAWSSKADLASFC